MFLLKNTTSYPIQTDSMKFVLIKIKIKYFNFNTFSLPSKSETTFLLLIPSPILIICKQFKSNHTFIPIPRWQFEPSSFFYKYISIIVHIPFYYFLMGLLMARDQVLKWGCFQACLDISCLNSPGQTGSTKHTHSFHSMKSIIRFANILDVFEEIHQNMFNMILLQTTKLLILLIFRIRNSITLCKFICSLFQSDQSFPYF